MGKHGKALTFLYLFFVVFTLLSPTLSANSAEPPGFTIIAVSPPDDASVTLRFADGKTSLPLTVTKVGWETYYRFYYYGGSDRVSFDGATIQFDSGEKSFSFAMPYQAQKYSAIYTLDFNDETLIVGKDPMRDIFLISIRVTLTLLIEGIIFAAFGFRARASWIAFFAINLATQGALNVFFSGPYDGGYWMIAYVLFELLIIIGEPLIAMAVIREKRKLRAWLCFLFANIMSLIIGGLAITHIPV